MSLNIIFWVLMFMGLFYNGWNTRNDFGAFGSWGVTWFLMALLGWKVYPISFN